MGRENQPMHSHSKNKEIGNFEFKNFDPNLVSKAINWSRKIQFLINKDKISFCSHSLIHTIEDKCMGQFSMDL
jgi:hypothetical protein